MKFTVKAQGKEIQCDLWTTPEGYATNVALKVGGALGIPGIVVAKMMLAEMTKCR